MAKDEKSSMLQLGERTGTLEMPPADVDDTMPPHSDPYAATVIGASEAGRSVSSGEEGGRLRPLRLGDQVGRFVLEHRLGEGGMGAVFAARDPELQRDVAVKVLHPNSDGSDTVAAQARMLREAQAMAMLSHPNLVAIFEAGLHQDSIFIVMENVTGQTLDDWLRESHPLEDIMEVFDQAGRGLHAVHEAGLVHRDFKPSNVMVTEAEIAKVLDLGIARKVSRSQAEDLASLRADQESGMLASADASRLSPPEALGPKQDAGDAFVGNLTLAGSIVGTPAYMAPEQIMGLEVGPAADQFSFAIAVFEALTKIHPFPGNNHVQVMANIAAGVHRDWPADCGVPDGLRAAIERALRPEALERYPDMVSFLDACREGLGLRGQLRFLTARWTSHDRDPQYLLPRGALLDEGTYLFVNQPEALNDEQREFVENSRSAVAKRKFQRRVLLGGVATLGLGVVTTAALLRRRSDQLEDAQRREVETQIHAINEEVMPLFERASEDLQLIFEQRQAWLGEVGDLLTATSKGNETWGRDLPQAFGALNAYFRPLIQQRETISSLMIARDDDLELLFFDDPDARELKPAYQFYNRLVWRPVVVDDAFEVFWEADDSLRPRGHLLVAGQPDSRGQTWSKYSPTERLWFKQASVGQEGEVNWTQPYLFFITKDAGVTGGIHWTEDGRKYVLAVDFMLTDLSKVTTGVEDDHILAVVLTKEGRVVGVPRDPRFRDGAAIRSYFSQYNERRQEEGEIDAAARLPALKDLGHEELTAAYAQRVGRGEAFRYEFKGGQLWAAIRPIGVEQLGLDVLVVQVSSPEK